MLPLLLIACAEKVPSEEPFEFPAASDGPALRGPGGPAVGFAEDELWVNCAALEGGAEDALHHNLVVPYRGHLVMPWAPEFGQGGLSFFDVSDPCAPAKVGEGFHERMRESHSLGFVHLPEGDPHAGDYVVVNGIRGVQIWDITDETAPEMIHYLEIETVFYPDAYARVVLSVFWQYPWIYAAAADNGVFVINAEDPRAPELVTTYPIEPALRAGGAFALGDLLLITSAEGAEAVLLDISVPDQPQPIGGGRFASLDGAGEPQETYHGNLAGDWALFARKENGGGVMIMDISDPSSPTYAGDYLVEGGNGGYVFYDEGYAFVGESHFADVFDVSDPANITLVGQGDLPGDLDTVTPYGNVAILSVDEDTEDGIASAVMPWSTDIDLAPPAVLRVRPPDGATGVATTARIGVSFNEFIEPASAFAGSIRLYDADGNAVDGWGSGQESVASYAPKEPLEPGMTYRLEVVAGGITDVNGNAVAETVTSTFTTAGP